MCDPLTFPMTATEFAALQAKAATEGLAMSFDSGETVQHGCTISWNYSVADGQFTVQCLSKPFYVSCDAINGKLKELIQP